jgi:hypothetical protein
MRRLPAGVLHAPQAHIEQVVGCFYVVKGVLESLL